MSVLSDFAGDGNPPLLIDCSICDWEEEGDVKNFATREATGLGTYNSWNTLIVNLDAMASASTRSFIDAFSVCFSPSGP